jgi:P-type Mg2+ transporter
VTNASASNLIHAVANQAVVPVAPLANTLGFVPVPPLYWLYLAAMLLAYAVLTQLVKIWFIRRFGE